MKDKNIFKKELYVSFLLNMIVVFVIAATYFKYIEGSNHLLAKIYNVLSTVSHFISLFLPVLLISLAVYWLSKNQKIAKIVFATLTLFFIVILKLDTMVYSQFRYHLSPFVFKLVFGKGAGDIFQFSTIEILVTISQIIGLIVIQILFFKLAKRIVNKKFNLHVKLSVAIFFIALIFSHLIFAWSDASYFRPITQIAHVYPLYHPLTAQSFLTKNNFVDREKVRKNRELYKITSTNSIVYPLSKITATKPVKQKNIIFLTIDSWRYDTMDSIITPNLYKLSKKSQNYTNHYSGSNGTLAGVFSMFYGITGLYWEQFTQLERSPVFIDELIKQSYIIDVLGSANIQNPPFDKNIFSSVENLRLSSKGKSPADRDVNITNDFIKNIEKYKGEKPFFSFIFYDAAHGFSYPKDYDIKFKPSLKKVKYSDLHDDYDGTELYNRYKNSLHFIDNQIALIIAELEKNNLLESTIIVVTGDHGQEFNDNKKGYWQHGGNYSKHQIKVPMFVYDASKPFKIYNELSLHYDIVPTMMNSYLGVTTPIIDYCSGQNLYNLSHRDWFVCGYNNNYAIIEKDRITKVFATGLFDITDKELNKMMEAELHYDIIKDALKEINKFYEKK